MSSVISMPGDAVRAQGGAAKRLLDILVASAALIAAGLPMALIAAAIRLTMRGPVLFRQRRPGLGGRPFTMVKFRTMRDTCDASGRPLPDSERLTRLGSFLRKSSLDELPELWNVLTGEMSLVGPRPLLMEYLARYTPEQARRHEVKPGVTGWAQVHGRNAISWEDKFRLDVWYVDHRSLWLDVRILWRTLACVVFRTGISAQSHATMPMFEGTKPDVVACELVRSDLQR